MAFLLTIYYTNMRTITKKIKLYSFDELSEEAKEKAHREYWRDEHYFWENEALASLTAVFKYFDSTLADYNIDWLEKYRCSIKIEVPDYMDELSRKEFRDLIIGMGSYDKETLKGKGDCKFTGYDADESVCDGIRIAYANGERDMYNLLYAGYKTWLDACNKDAEYQFSMEGFVEHCKINEYEFTEDGELYG